MQKHAVLIFSHNPLRHLIPILDYFDDNFDIFVHYDKGVRLNEEDLTLFLSQYPHIRFFRKYRFRWGGIPIVRAELKLISEILTHDHYTYIHIISDSDRPIKSLADFKAFFKQNDGKEYVGCFPLPDSRWEQGTLRRFELFRLNDILNYRSRVGKFLIELSNRIQLRIGIKRSPYSLPKQLYGGSTWMSITYACAKYIIDNQEYYHSFLKRLRWTFGADEVFLQTIIMNSPFATNVTFDDCRYTKWKPGAPSPNWLTIKDCFEISISEKMFARKFHSSDSTPLWRWINAYLLNSNPPEIGNYGKWISKNFSGHVFDNGLAQCIKKIILDKGIKRAVDMGCGPGWYVAFLRRLGIEAYGFDANPYTGDISTNLFDSTYRCECLDLSKTIIFDLQFDLVISIEVGEHIPQEYQNTFIDNLTINCSNSLLLSWALPDQVGDGHINPKNPESIIKEISQRGLLFNREKTILYRSLCSHEWLKKTLLFFERQPNGQLNFCKGSRPY